MNHLTKSTRLVELEGNMGSAEFWELSVDGELITTNARPFDASSSEIVLNECEACSMCGMKEVTARRIGESTIAWYVTLDDGYSPKIPRGQMLFFDRFEYERLFGGCATVLEQLGSVDIQYFLASVIIPDWHNALYTIPTLPLDSMGRSTLRILMASLTAPGLCVHPGDWEVQSEIRIGVDVTEIPESVIQLNFGLNNIRFRLFENPKILLWLSHATVNSELPALIANSDIYPRASAADHSNKSIT